MLKFSIYLLVLHNKSGELFTMSGVSVFGILEVLLLAPLFVLDILVILCVLVTLCVLDILVLLCVLDILVLLCVLSYCYHMMCTELLSNERRLHTQNHLQQGDGELSATSRFVQLWYQILLSVDLLVSQSCPEEDRSQPHRSSWSHWCILVMAAPYLVCLHWEKMELLPILEILAALYLECLYY